MTVAAVKHGTDADRLVVAGWEWERRYAICQVCPHFTATSVRCALGNGNCRRHCRLAAAVCPQGHWNDPNGPKAAPDAFIGQSGLIRKNQLEAMIAAAKACGVTLRIVRGASFAENLKPAAGWATWGMRRPLKYFTGLWQSGKHLLFYENGYFCQSDGCYVDHEGMFYDNSIRQTAEWELPPTLAERLRVTDIMCRHFKTDFWGGGNPAGPILVALQHESDHPCVHYFPLRGRDPAVATALRLASEHLPPGRDVVVRPHPRFLKEWTAMEGKVAQYFRPGWRVEATAADPKGPHIYAQLRQYAAVVTINSTLGREAAAYGIPVALLGQDAGTGSGAYLDCSADPTLLAGLLDFRPNPDKVMGYVCALLRHQVPVVNCTVDTWLNQTSFRIWCERIRRMNGVS